MKQTKLLKRLIIISTVALLSIIISPNAHAQFGYFGPYYPGPFCGYFPRPVAPPLSPVPYRGAQVLLPTLLPTTLTVPAVTPAGLSVTTLVPPAPATITVTLPATAAATLTPTLVAPTVATTIPGIATALLLSGGGISTTTLLLLGI